MTTMIDQEDEVTQFVDDEDVIDEVEVPVEDVLVGPQGNTTFTTRDLPWMKLGPRIDAAVPMEEATKLGGLNFDVELKPLVYRNGDRLVEIPSRRAVIRTNPEMFFAVASDDYQPVQFSEAFSFLDEINPLVSSAGALSGGKKGRRREAQRGDRRRGGPPRHVRHRPDVARPLEGDRDRGHAPPAEVHEHVGSPLADP
jgi:hypothetical protein